MPLIPGPILTPAHLFTPDEEVALKASLGPRLIAAVQRAGGNSQSNILYRDLVASDIQSGNTRLQNANATSLGSSTFTSIFSGSAGFSLPITQAIGVFGFMSFDASPLIDILKFFLGASGTPFGQVNVCQAYGDNRLSKCYFEPMIWKPQEVMDVQALANSSVAQNTANFLLIGLIAETWGKTITPRTDLGDLTPVNV